MRAGPVVVVALVVTVAVSGVAVSRPAPGCSAPPCPPYPPFLLVALGPGEDRPTLAVDDLPATIPGVVTWRYDVDRYGPFVWEPADRPEVRLEIEFAPAWLDATVEPSAFPVELSPASVRGDGSRPTDPQVRYVYRRNITLTLDADDPPAEPPPGREAWAPGLSARSTASGTVAAAYGYGEVVVAPAGSDAEPHGPGTASVPGFEAWSLLAVVVGAAVVRRRGCRR